MKENKVSKFKKPEISFVSFSTTDIISTSGWEGEPQEGELIPIIQPENGN